MKINRAPQQCVTEKGRGQNRNLSGRLPKSALFMKRFMPTFAEKIA